MLRFMRTVVLVLITVLVTIFFVQNLATIEVAFLTWSFAAPRALVFLLVFVLGLAMGYLLHAFRTMRQPSPGAMQDGVHE